MEEERYIPLSIAIVLNHRDKVSAILFIVMLLIFEVVGILRAGMLNFL